MPDPVPERLPALAPSRQSLFVRLVRWFATRKLGRDTGPMRVMTHHGGVLAGVGAMETALERCRTVPARLKTLKADPWAELPKLRQSISARVRREVGI